MMRARRAAIVFVALLVLASSAWGVRRCMIRVGPDGAWCPIGITGGGLGPYTVWNSDPSIPNLGVFELSFVAPQSGETTLIVETEDIGSIDNIFMVPRDDLFDNGLSLWDLTVCHKGSDGQFPDSRAPAFSGAMPAFDFAETFDDDQTTLEAAGWNFLNATVGAVGTSATEAVVLGDDTTISASCPPGVACTTRAVAMNGAVGNPATVTAPITGLQPGVTYTVVAWWAFDSDAEVFIEIVEPVIEIPTLGAEGASLLVLLLLAAGIFFVRRRHPAV